MKNLDFEPILIYDGFDEGFYTWNHKVILDNKEIELGNVFLWGEKYLNNLKFGNSIIQKAFFKSLPFLTVTSNPNSLHGYFGNTVLYKTTRVNGINYLILLSTDEINVGRYQIYVEGVIEFENGELIE